MWQLCPVTWLFWTLLSGAWYRYILLKSTVQFTHFNMKLMARPYFVWTRKAAILRFELYCILHSLFRNHLASVRCLGTLAPDTHTHRARNRKWFYTTRHQKFTSATFTKKQQTQNDLELDLTQAYGTGSDTRLQLTVGQVALMTDV